MRRCLGLYGVCGYVCGCEGDWVSGVGVKVRETV